MSTTRYADFGIEKVRKGNNGNITSLLLHRLETDNSMQRLGWYSKTDVINSIEKDNRTYMTITIENGTWYKGSDVHVVTTIWGKYLRTDQNSTSEDNLGNLPEG